MPWLPTIDGAAIPRGFWDAVPAGQYNKVPLVIGTVWEEALLFIYQAWNKTLSTEAYEGTRPNNKQQAERGRGIRGILKSKMKEKKKQASKLRALSDTSVFQLC